MVSKKINKIKKSRFKLKPPQKDRLKAGLQKSILSKVSPTNESEKQTDFKETLNNKEEISFSFDSQKLDKSPKPEKHHDPDSASSNNQTQKTESVSEESEKLYEEKIQALEKSFMYLKADFENYKKRTMKEKMELIRYGGEEFILALANEVLDDLDRAYEDFQNTKSLESFKSGIDLIHKNLHTILNRFHIEANDPEGQPFDPRYHEALSRQPTSKMPKDHVLVTFKKAYTLYQKLIRPAQVIVATTEEDTSDSP